MRQLEKFSDWVISSEATRRRAERSQTTQSNLSLDEMGTSAGQPLLSVEDIVGPAIKVADARIKSLVITLADFGMTMHHGIGAMAG